MATKKATAKVAKTAKVFIGFDYRNGYIEDYSVSTSMEDVGYFNRVIEVEVPKQPATANVKKVSFA